MKLGTPSDFNDINCSIFNEPIDQGVTDFWEPKLAIHIYKEAKSSVTVCSAPDRLHVMSAERQFKVTAVGLRCITSCPIQCMSTRPIASWTHRTSSQFRSCCISFLTLALVKYVRMLHQQLIVFRYTIYYDCCPLLG
jgi:hypothetical protein